MPVKLIHKQEEVKSAMIDVNLMGAKGRGKIQYVGGWAIKKCLDMSKCYVVGSIAVTSCSSKVKH